MKKALSVSVALVLLTVSMVQFAPATRAADPQFLVPVMSDSVSIPQGASSIHSAGNLTVNILVSLKLNNISGLELLISRQSNPSSSLYERWLTPAEFESEFSPRLSQVHSVTSYLEGKGIRILHVSSNRMLIEARATGAELKSAFGVMLYSFNYRGSVYYTAEGRAMLPPQIASAVDGIEGLQNFDVAEHPHVYLTKRASPSYVPPVSPDAQPPYNPATIHEAYNFTGIYRDGFSGAGTSVSIVTAYAFSNATVANFDSVFGISPYRINVIQPAGYTNQLDLETTLDTEWMTATAPNATINVVEGPNPQLQTFTELFNYVAEHNLSSVMTTSWGTPESETPASVMTADNQTFMQAAAEGITTFVASGDFGAYDNTSSPTPDFPASSPFVTGVGGTWLNLTQVGGNVAISSETGWNRSGGGMSSVFSRPTWQTGYGDFQGNGREVPDVSLDAKPSSGYFVYYNSTWDEAGGTSFGAPIWGGMMALENQIRASRGENSVGFINPDIYRILNSNNYTIAFNDITKGYNGYYSAGPGYSMVTGIGTPSVYNLLLILAKLPTQPLRAVATGSPGWGDAPLNVSLYASITGGIAPYSIAWALNASSGNGWKNFSDSRQYMLRLDYAGSYHIRLTVKDNASEISTSFFNVSALAPPSQNTLNASLTGTPSNGDANLTVSFSASLSGGPSIAVSTYYSYAFADGAYLISQRSGVSHTYSTGGNFTVLVTAYENSTQGNFTAQGTFSLRVYPHLVARISSPRYSGSYPLTLTFRADPYGGRPPYTYSWSFTNVSGTRSYSGGVLNVTYTSTGNYSVSLTVRDYYSSVSTVTASIRIYSPLTGTIAVLPSSNGVAPYNATFNASVSGGSGVYFYKWHFGSGSTATGNPVNHVFANGGTYSVRLTVTDSAGDSVNITTNVTIQGLGLIPLLENSTTLIILVLMIIVAATASYFIVRRK